MYISGEATAIVDNGTVNTAAIGGAVGGSIVGIMIVVGIVVLLIRKRR